MDTFEAQAVAIDGYGTVPALFWHRVRTRADKIALREKDRGIWKSYTWGEYGARAKAVGMGLIALGLKPGERAAILRSADAVGMLEAHAVWPGGRLKISRPASGGTRKWVPVRRHRTLDEVLAAHPGPGRRSASGRAAERQDWQ